MKPEEMNQEVVLNWIKNYLVRSKANLQVVRSDFYDAVVADDNVKAELILREMVVKQAVHANLLEEVYEAEEYAKMIEQLAKAAENAPKA
jgi:hypothetical protein